MVSLYKVIPIILLTVLSYLSVFNTDKSLEYNKTAEIREWQNVVRIYAVPEYNVVKAIFITGENKDTTALLVGYKTNFYKKKLISEKINETQLRKNLKILVSKHPYAYYKHMYFDKFGRRVGLLRFITKYPTILRPVTVWPADLP